MRRVIGFGCLDSIIMDWQGEATLSRQAQGDACGDLYEVLPAVGVKVRWERMLISCSHRGFLTGWRPFVGWLRPVGSSRYGGNGHNLFD